MIDRYQLRRGPNGYGVFDVWTGETAVIAMTPQDALSREDAEHTAELLNRRARQGERSVPQ